MLSEFSLDPKPLHISMPDHTFTKNSLMIPVSINKDSLGEALEVTISNGFISDIRLSIKGARVNFLSLIYAKAKILRNNHPDKITSFDAGFKFYSLLDNKRYILAVKKLGDASIEKIRYSLDGVIISRITDRIVNNYVIRNTGGKVTVFKDNKVLSINQTIKLKAIDKPNIEPLFVENDNIGVIDLECYKNIRGIDKVYALGFKTKIKEKPVTYYIDSDKDSDALVLKMVNELLRTIYNKTIFYCHNLGGYDSLFVLSALLRYNDNKDKTKKNGVISFLLQMFFTLEYAFLSVIIVACY